MSSISNERFNIYIKFFLSLALHYSVGFNQILIQILMKKLGIRILRSSSLSAVETSKKKTLTLTLRWSYQGGWGLFAEFKSYSEVWQILKRIVDE